jgi:ABC-2 type transport system ATP-binding protein
VANAIEIRELSKTYQSSLPWAKTRVEAVRSLSLSVPAGEIFGLLGPNGAGKTTTIKMIAGLVEEDSGTISFPAWSRRPCIGAVLEGSRNLYWRLSCWENIRYIGELKGVPLSRLKEQSDELLQLFGLSDKRDSAAQTLSRGMQQKLAVVLAFLGDPELLLLDEPTLGLDVASSLAIQKLLRKLCRERGVSIVITTHQMDVAQSLCRSVAIMRGGEVALSDRVDNLVDLFKRQEYSARMPQADFERLAKALSDPPAELGRLGHELLEEQREGQVSLRFQLEEPAAVYALMRLFEAQGVRLEDFRQELPTLETIFVSVTEKEPAPAEGAGL